MKDNLRQSLSALMDNEASEFEVRRVLERLDDDSADTWSRYHVARSVLKGEEPPVANFDISHQVREVLVDEPSHRTSLRLASFWRPLVSVAVAASVTAVVIFGAQTYQGQPGGDSVDAVAQAGLVLPGPSPVTSSLMPAQYGRSGTLTSGVLAEADVIRVSSQMDHYIQQHQSLMQDEQRLWTAGWMPDGFSPVRHEVMPGSEVILYSNGRTTISVCVEPIGKQKAEAGVVQQGDTVALGKRVGRQFVTVVGDIPLMIADRIASSVDPVVN